LIAAREKVERFEGELEEPWKESTRHAKEMYQVEAAGLDSDSDDDEEVDVEGTAVIGHVEVVTVPPPPLYPTPDLFLLSQRNPPQIDLPSHLHHLSPSCIPCHSAPSKPFPQR